MSILPTVSIALATFNSERFLLDQLKSLAAQSYLPIEIVVGDDGSTDGTFRILDEFAKSAPFPVRVVRNQERLGYAENFLATAARCSGDLIAFCDHDDVWMPNKLQRCAEEFTRPEVQLVTHALAEVDSELKFLGKLPRIRSSFTIPCRAQSRSLPYNQGCALVVRRAVVCEMKKRWPPEHLPLSRKRGGSLLGHDEIAFFVANGLGDIRYLAEPLVQHRAHGGNVTNPLPTITMQARVAATAGKLVYIRQSRDYTMKARLTATMANGKGNASVSSVLSRRAREMTENALFARVRSRIYAEPRRLNRLLLILKMGRRGLYRTGLGPPWGLRIAKDVAVALVQPKERLAQ